MNEYLYNSLLRGWEHGWVNQPSKQQAYHRYHGEKILYQPDPSSNYYPNGMKVIFKNPPKTAVSLRPLLMPMEAIAPAHPDDSLDC